VRCRVGDTASMQGLARPDSGDEEGRIAVEVGVEAAYGIGRRVLVAIQESVAPLHSRPPRRQQGHAPADCLHVAPVEIRRQSLPAGECDDRRFGGPGRNRQGRGRETHRRRGRRARNHGEAAGDARLALVQGCR